jgi:hypothetical protein
MNHVWRTNDIVYLPDSPRGRRGGQYFPRPMWEKNGSRDAFRYYTHSPTGGSDHICFNNPAVAVPGIELNIWPDQWYHADTDTPDKSDPTQLKRTAFISAAMAWAAADCSDGVLAKMLDVVSTFGYERVGKRELPTALRRLEAADGDSLQASLEDALNLVDFAVTREIGALRSTDDIHTGSGQAQNLVEDYTAQWHFYEEGLHRQLLEYARLKAKKLGAEPPQRPELTPEEKKYARVIPAVHPDARAKEFSVTRSQAYLDFTKANPDAIKELGIDARQRRIIPNYVNGRRSVTEIGRCVWAESGKPVKLDALVAYLEILKEVGWLTF